MGQSTLMHCSGWMELAKVEAASSAALTTWNESRARPYVNEVTLDSQHHWCVLGMTARKCLGMFINRSTGDSVKGPLILRLHILCLQWHRCSSNKSWLPNVTVSELWLVWENDLSPETDRHSHPRRSAKMTSLQPLSRNPTPPAKIYTKWISLSITPMALVQVSVLSALCPCWHTHGSCVLPLPSWTTLQSNPAHGHKWALGCPQPGSSAPSTSNPSKQHWDHHTKWEEEQVEQTAAPTLCNKPTLKQSHKARGMLYSTLP